MSETGVREQAAAAALRAAGAAFALVHGSRATGTHRADSDLDVAGWWSADPPAAFQVRCRPGSTCSS